MDFDFGLFMFKAFMALGIWMVISIAFVSIWMVVVAVLGFFRRRKFRKLLRKGSYQL